MGSRFGYMMQSGLESVKAQSPPVAVVGKSSRRRFKLSLHPLNVARNCCQSHRFTECDVITHSLPPIQVEQAPDSLS
ncbi:hypothetical protein TNCV_1353811 [Trichonephila clavipes]|nr:hypothetical protein TNCV_1353811 [Trichonephila clavipes]